MAGSVNRVILVGNLGRDPEMRALNDGTRIANLNIATSESWVDKRSGERQERTEWHKIVIFNEKLAEIAEKYLKKGSKCYLEGQLQTRKWTDNSNQERYTTEIVLNRFRGELVMLGDTGGGSRTAQRGDYDAGYDGGPDDTTASRVAPPTSRARAPVNDLDDAIPFATCDPAFEPYLKRRIVA